MTLAKVRSRRVAASSVAADARGSVAFVPVDASIARRTQVVASVADASETALQVVATAFVADPGFVTLVHVRTAPTITIQLVT